MSKEIQRLMTDAERRNFFFFFLFESLGICQAFGSLTMSGCNFPFGFLFNGGVFYFFSLLPPLGRRTKGKLHPGIACLFMVAHQFSATANNKKRWLNNERQIRNRHERFISRHSQPVPPCARRRNICWARTEIKIGNRPFLPVTSPLFSFHVR